MKLFLACLFGVTLGQKCGRNIYPMSPNILTEVLGGEYKAEWDSPVELPPVPDYEETLIWDAVPMRRRREADKDQFNPENGEVGNFEHPDFWDLSDDSTQGGRATGDDKEYTGPPIARIVGGKIAKPFSYPWMVRVRACSGFACTRMCGGTLVSDRAVVTASHCIPPYAQTGVITLGAHEYYNTRAFNVSIASIHQHPGWNKSTRINDIAVIILQERVQFSNKIQPACLPNKNHCFAPGTACIATGWGYMKEGGPRSSLLREVPVRMMSSKHCNSADYYNGRVKEGMLCAGYNKGQRDACTGDSGGPLVCPIETNMGTRWVLAGVTSWGVGCARHQRPGVYSSVAEFSDWIGALIREYPSVEGKCTPKGNGYGYDGDWSWSGTMPMKKPDSQLFFHNGQGFGAEVSGTTQYRPPKVQSHTPVAHQPTMPQAQFKPPSPQQFNSFVPPVITTPAPIDPFATPVEKIPDCSGKTGKALKKCKKGSSGASDKSAKKAAKAAKKAAKANKKKNKKAKSMEFDGLTKKEIKKLMKQQQQEEEESMRGNDMNFSTENADEDDNTKFGMWDLLV